MIKQGSRWSSSDGKKFIVISVITIDNKNWVHYRLETATDESPLEFSCFEESFLARFSPYTNEQNSVRNNH